jgi:hypothetical protein
MIYFIQSKAEQEQHVRSKGRRAAGQQMEGLHQHAR